MSEDLEDIRFERLLADKRHKELTSVLKTIKESFSNKAEEAISLAIDKQSEVIKGFVKAVKSLPEPKVNVTVDNSEIEIAIKQLGESIAEMGSNNKLAEDLKLISKKGQDTLKSLEETKILLLEIRDLLLMLTQPKEVVFTFTRGQYTGLIEKAVAKELITKSKYQA